GLVLNVVHIFVGLVAGYFEEELAGKRVSIRMQAIGRQTYKYVSNLYFGPGEYLLALHHANDKTGEIIFAFGIKTRHLACFSADQCAAILFAGFSQASDDLLRHVWIESAASEVVHKEERSCALHHNVIYAVVHEVSADGVVHAHHESDLQLRADAIGTRDQYWVLVLILIDGKQAAKAANLAEKVLAECLLGKVFDPLLGSVSAGDVHSSVGIGNRTRPGLSGRWRLLWSQGASRSS